MNRKKKRQKETQTARFSKLTLYALKSEFPNTLCSGAPVGPEPIRDALSVGLTVRTAVASSSKTPVVTYLLDQIVARLRVDALDEDREPGRRAVGCSWPWIKRVG